MENKRATALKWWRKKTEAEQRKLVMQYLGNVNFESITRSSFQIERLYEKLKGI